MTHLIHKLSTSSASWRQLDWTGGRCFFPIYRRQSCLSCLKSENQNHNKAPGVSDLDTVSHTRSVLQGKITFGVKIHTSVGVAHALLAVQPELISHHEEIYIRGSQQPTASHPKLKGWLVRQHQSMNKSWYLSCRWGDNGLDKTLSFFRFVHHCL